mmetsp:Transcript_4440/g.14399  ORF Transcript_4440/g.14399 Transcript_4440/m.14399 type:complete len:101 (+) Transcript_4440:458-760(+)
MWVDELPTFTGRTFTCSTIEPPETWNPMWSVASILTGLMSFMYDEHQSTTGSITTSKAEKQGFAEKSLDYNVVKSPMFRKLFPEWVDEAKKREVNPNPKP